ncbi:hypothetical protein CFIO01_09557 [Colletotrichum fioriniae PJ7]|uniref:Uncharacterized protein n=1 Tax=Colletotrichum fioriniae PJ7 TaxID=1445577 RepID=A0A010RMQ7_9PEZI|nr:hypothetical protein CFIO01_09557 [Colletotrichum fioriniae PJ7]
MLKHVRIKPPAGGTAISRGLNSCSTPDTAPFAAHHLPTIPHDDLPTLPDPSTGVPLSGKPQQGEPTLHADGRPTSTECQAWLQNFSPPGRGSLPLEDSRVQGSSLRLERTPPSPGRSSHSMRIFCGLKQVSAVLKHAQQVMPEGCSHRPLHKTGSVVDGCNACRWSTKFTVLAIAHGVRLGAMSASVSASRARRWAGAFWRLPTRAETTFFTRDPALALATLASGQTPPSFLSTTIRRVNLNPTLWLWLTAWAMAVHRAPDQAPDVVCNISYLTLPNGNLALHISRARPSRLSRQQAADKIDMFHPLLSSSWVSLRGVEPAESMRVNAGQRPADDCRLAQMSAIPHLQNLARHR